MKSEQKYNISNHMHRLISAGVVSVCEDFKPVGTNLLALGGYCLIET